MRALASAEYALTGHRAKRTKQSFRTALKKLELAKERRVHERKTKTALAAPKSPVIVAEDFAQEPLGWAVGGQSSYDAVEARITTEFQCDPLNAVRNEEYRDEFARSLRARCEIDSTLWPNVVDYLLPPPAPGLRHVDVTPHTVNEDIAEAMRGGSDFVPHPAYWDVG